MIQIYVALIAYILLKIYKNMLGSATELRLKDIMVSLRTGLFMRPDMLRKRQQHRDKTFHNQHTLWGFE